MARTLPEIYDAIIAEKEAQSALTGYMLPEPESAQLFLSDVNTPSRVARWRVMVWTLAVAIWTHEMLWDLMKAEIQAIAAASHIGTLRWYVEKAKAFQYGHALVSVNNVPGYAVDDPVARIIVRSAAKEQSGFILLKVAKSVSGDLVGLDPTEMLAFEEYVDEVKMAGVIIHIISDVGDMLKIPATVYYDPLVMNPNGSLILSPSVFPVEDAINAYLANLPFNGAFVLTSLVDAMQQAEGAVNPVLGTVQAKYGLFPYEDVVVQYIANAGHVIIDPANPLSSTITYVPHVV